jgi:hypothetical protein
MIKSFLVGLIAGATASLVFKESIAARIDTRTRAIRAKTAHGLRTAADVIEDGAAESPGPDKPSSHARGAAGP